MRRMMAMATVVGAGLCGGCGGATETAEAADAPAARKPKVELFVVNRSGVALDQVGMQMAGARISFDEVDPGETERVTLTDGLEPRSMSWSWRAVGGPRYSASLAAPAGITVATVTIDSSHRATLTTR